MSRMGRRHPDTQRTERWIEAVLQIADHWLWFSENCRSIIQRMSHSAQVENKEIFSWTYGNIGSLSRINARKEEEKGVQNSEGRITKIPIFEAVRVWTRFVWPKIGRSARLFITRQKITFENNDANFLRSWFKAGFEKVRFVEPAFIRYLHRTVLLVNWC
jgi:hypothetical protein